MIGESCLPVKSEKREVVKSFVVVVQIRSVFEGINQPIFEHTRNKNTWIPALLFCLVDTLSVDLY
jgi:hypothetical protein